MLYSLKLMKPTLIGDNQQMLEVIVFTLFVSTLLNLLLKYFHVPTIIGYIATGVIIAYGFGLHDAVHKYSLSSIY